MLVTSVIPHVQNYANLQKAEGRPNWDGLPYSGLQVSEDHSLTRSFFTRT